MLSITIVLHVRHADHPHAVVAPGLLHLPHLGPLQPHRVKPVHSGGGGGVRSPVLVIPAALAPCPNTRVSHHTLIGHVTCCDDLIVDGDSLQADQSLRQGANLCPGVPALMQYLCAGQYGVSTASTTRYTWPQAHGQIVMVILEA